MTAQERQAIGFLIAVTLLGAGVRVVKARSNRLVATTPDSIALALQLQAVDSAASDRARFGKKSRGRSSRIKEADRTDDREEPARTATLDITAMPEVRGATAPASARSRNSGRVDLDVATQQEIETLPWVGPGLAARIIESRNACGPFGSLEGLKRVRGIGARTAERLAEHVVFSGRADSESTTSTPCSR